MERQRVNNQGPGVPAATGGTGGEAASQMRRLADAIDATLDRHATRNAERDLRNSAQTGGQ